MQSRGRKMVKRVSFNRLQARRCWAATTIQRNVRGMQSRRRVATIIEELFDTGQIRWVEDIIHLFELLMTAQCSISSLLQYQLTISICALFAPHVCDMIIYICVLFSPPDCDMVICICSLCAPQDLPPQIIPYFPPDLLSPK